MKAVKCWLAYQEETFFKTKSSKWFHKLTENMQKNKIGNLSSHIHYLVG